MLKNKVVIILLILFVPLFIFSEGLVLQYKCSETNISSNQIRYHINIVNNGNSAENLSELKVRYYFTKEGAASQNMWIDYAVIGSENISGQFVQFGEVDYYLELSFSADAGILEPGDETGEIQIRFHKTDWTVYDQSNDYSFNKEISSFTDYEKITIYKNDVLIWGKAPGDISLNITKTRFYTKLTQSGGLTFGHTMLEIEGNTDADKVNVRVWGDGVIGYVDLPIDASGNFNETVEICFTHAPDNRIFTVSTTVTASKDSITKLEEVTSGELQYIEDILLNITESRFYTQLSVQGGMEYGHTMLDISGNTDADEVKVKVWGAGAITYVNLAVDADGKFSETVELCYVFLPDQTPFTVETEVIAEKGTASKTTILTSPELRYKELDKWIPYYDNTASIEISKNSLGEHEAKVTLHFTSAGFRITDWGTSINPDANVEMWTGYHAMVLTDIPHTYNLGILEPGEHTFIFKTWGNITASKTFFIEGGSRPNVEIVTPKNGQEFMTNNTADIDIKANADDPDGDIVEVVFYANDKNNPSYLPILIGTDKTYPYEITWNNVMPGDYTINATAVDSEGNEGYSQTVEIQVIKTNEQWIPYYDNVAHITFTKNYKNEYEAEVTLHFPSTGFRVTDWGTSLNPDAKVEMWTGMHAMMLTDISHTYNLGVLEPGEHTFTFKTWGNITTESKFIVDGIPTVKIVNPKDGDEIVVDDVSGLIIEAETFDPDGDIKEVVFKATDKNRPTYLPIMIGTVTAPPYNVVWQNMLESDYTLYAEVTDEKGNKGYSNAVNIKIMKSQQPYLNITSPKNNQVFNYGEDVLIKADAVDPNYGIEKVEFLVTIYENGAAAGIVLGEDNTAPYELLWDKPGVGNYDISVKATINNGQEMIETINIDVINDVPGLKVQYQCMEQAALSNSVRANLNIINEGIAPVPLTELEVRYYFTLENPSDMQFNCDYAVIGSSNIDEKFVNTGNDNYYLSLTFKNGQINAGGESGIMQLRWNKLNWTQMDQANDYSFNSAITALTDWDKVAIFRNGKLVWGVIPAN